MVCYCAACDDDLALTVLIRRSILLPILTDDGLDTFDPDLTADDLVTNEYIDPNISFQG